MNRMQSLRIVATVILLAAIAWARPIFAGETDGLFHQANQHYQVAEYGKAAENYETILALGWENWTLHYNLGNAYFKQRQIGKAILHYERSLALDPKNEDIQFNLDLANLAITDHIAEPPRSLVVIWVDAAIHLLSMDETALVTLLFWILAFSGLVMVVLSSKHQLRTWGRRIAWSAGSIWLVFAIVFALQLYENSTVQHGIILERRVVVRSSPGESATEVFILHEGAKVQLQERSGDWTRIRLVDGKVGWLASEAVEKI